MTLYNKTLHKPMQTHIVLPFATHALKCVNANAEQCYFYSVLKTVMFYVVYLLNESFSQHGMKTKMLVVVCKCLKKN